MKQQAADTARDWMFLTFTGLGITFQPHLYFGGLFLALAAASVARRQRPERDRLELWQILGMAALVSTVAAIGVHALWPDIGPPLVPQMLMAACGWVSRPVVGVLRSLNDRIEERSTALADRIIDRVVPEDKDS